MIRINLWLGKYRILSVLNSSGIQSSVFLAENIRIQERCIIKKIRKSHPFFQTIRNEVVFLRLLKSRFLPVLYDVEEDDEALYIIMEYIETAESRHEVFKEAERDEKLFGFILQLSEFLCFIHGRDRKVLYLDWKPENIIFSEEGIKIIDFGSSNFLDEAFSGISLATSGYSAPEMVKGGDLGLHTDIYGFGCLIKEIAEEMSEKTVFPWKKNRKEKILRIAEHCMNQEPHKRWNLEKIVSHLEELRHSSAKKKKKRRTYDILIGSNERIIGVTGTFRGVGVTYFSILLANFFSMHGKNVALVFFGNVDEKSELLKRLKKEKKNLIIYQNISKDDLPSILNRGFHHIIVDFGMIKNGNLNEILRCDKKLIVIQYSGIKKDTEIGVLRQYYSILKEGNTALILNLCSKGDSKKVKKNLDKLGLCFNIMEQEFKKMTD